jgi:serine protease Do
MNVTGKLSSDDLVYINCPKDGCGTELRIKPKSAKTTVTCAKCGEKFGLEVTNMGPEAKSPAPVPTNDDAFRFVDEPKKSTPPPKSKRPRQPWEVDDEDRQMERRRRSLQETKSAPVGLIVGGVVAALLLVGGIAVGAIYLLHDKEKPSTPVASAPASERTVPPLQFSLPRDLPNPAAKTGGPATPSTAKSPIAPAPMKDPDPPAPAVVAEPKPPAPDPDDDPPPKGKSPPKKKGSPNGLPGNVGPFDKTAIDRVKKSTALIEAKGGWGTGFVIRPGIVMTNAHVIAGRMIDEFRVSFVSLDDTAPAPLKPMLLYTDPRRDLAIFRVDTDRPPLELTEPGTELSGLDVAIVGNPVGDAGQAQINKVTTGRLSAPIRRDAGWTYYELNAQAYFGNSGGPVVERNTGKLVGVIQSILGDGKQKSYCIPFGEALRALDSLPASKEDEPKATKIALARHFLDYIDHHLPIMEHNAELAMSGQLNKLRAKSFGGDVTVTVRTPDGRVSTMSLTEFMTLLKEKHTAIYPNFTKVMPNINASTEIPSSLKQLMRERIETYNSMYALANQSTKTEKAFLEAMDSRKAANVGKAKAFKDAYDKFLDELERSSLTKPK